jgi:hypothetical protein
MPPHGILLHTAPGFSSTLKRSAIPGLERSFRGFLWCRDSGAPRVMLQNATLHRIIRSYAILSLIPLHKDIRFNIFEQGKVSYEVIKSKPQSRRWTSQLPPRKKLINPNIRFPTSGTRLRRSFRVVTIKFDLPGLNGAR